MTSYIKRWKENGFLTARKTPVVNADLFKAIEKEIVALNDRGVQVQFWHVPRDQNTMADLLANHRLAGREAAQVMLAVLADDDE